MSARTRFEAQIRHYDTFRGREFLNALTTLVCRNSLSWFTDEQIAEIRDEMIVNEWSTRCRRREMQARNAAAIQSRQPKKETADAA